MHVRVFDMHDGPDCALSAAPLGLNLDSHPSCMGLDSLCCTDHSHTSSLLRFQAEQAKESNQSIQPGHWATLLKAVDA